MSGEHDGVHQGGHHFEAAAPDPGQPGQSGYGQPGYGPYPQQPYPQPYGYPGYGYPVQPPTNTLAILALVFAFVFAPAAIVMGAVARKQIRRTGEGGAGLATSGFVLGIVFTVLSVIWMVAALVFMNDVLHHVNQNN
jgi:hypothetical protein